MRCVQDAEVRRDANRDHHNSLEDAFQALQKAIAERQHNKMLPSTQTRADQKENKGTTKGTRFPPKPSNQTWPPRAQQTTVPTNVPIPVPVPPTAPVPVYPQPPSTSLKKLTVEERQRCIEQGLCFRCRQPGHSVANCPQPDNRPKN
jgi:hypothetical protein